MEGFVQTDDAERLVEHHLETIQVSCHEWLLVQPADHDDKAARVVEPHHAAKAHGAAYARRHCGKDLLVHTVAGLFAQLVQIAKVHADDGALAIAPGAAPKRIVHLGQQYRASRQSGGRVGAAGQAGQAL